MSNITKKQKTLTKNIIWEAVKEPLRLLALSVLAGLVSIGISVVVPTLESGSQNQVLLGASLLVVLRTIDKGLHLLGKERESATLTKGITRF